jgi:riboflavin biosynthesis pyrimidine reductase
LNIFSDANCFNTFRLASERFKGNSKINAAYFREKNKRLDLKDVFKYFYKQNLLSVLIEGGADIFSQFIEEDLFDDIYFIIAPKIIGEGLSAFNNFKIKDLNFSKVLKFKKSFPIGKDLILYFTK